MKTNTKIFASLMFLTLAQLSSFAGKPVDNSGGSSPSGPVKIPGGVYAESFIIDVSGTYILTGDRHLAPGSTASSIFVLAPNVTIDLGGFALYGFDGTGYAMGIETAEDEVHYPENVVVRNGTVQGFPSSGMKLDSGSMIDSVRALDNGGYGIAASYDAIIENCYAKDNGSTGIFAHNGIIRNCIARNSGYMGIQLSVGTVENCESSSNQWSGVAGACLTVRESRFYDNNRSLSPYHAGVSVGAQSMIERCKIYENKIQQVRAASTGVARENLISSTFAAKGIVVYTSTPSPDFNVKGNTFLGPIDAFNAYAHDGGNNERLNGAY